MAIHRSLGHPGHMTTRPLLAVLATVGLLLSLAACGDDDAATTAGDSSASAVESSSSTGAAESTAGTEPSETSQAGAPASRKPSGRASSRSAGPVAGSWIDYATWDADRAAYADTDVVLFFHADWCPSCRATEASLDADGVPDGLTVVKVDYDRATELRQKYGVTYQHTFVHVDDDGTKLAIWTGSASGTEIAAEV